VSIGGVPEVLHPDNFPVLYQMLLDLETYGRLIPYMVLDFPTRTEIMTFITEIAAIFNSHRHDKSTGQAIPAYVPLSLGAVASSAGTHVLRAAAAAVTAGAIDRIKPVVKIIAKIGVS